MPYSRLFQCQTCPDKPEFDDPAKLNEHLVRVHKLAPEPGHSGPKGRRSMDMALDGAMWYQNSYTWSFGKGPTRVVIAEQEARRPEA